MRTATAVGFLALGLTLPVRAADDSAVTSAVVTESAETRAGPTEKYPATGSVRRGDTVSVHHADGDWLAILPPAGSVSWINHRYLSEPQNAAGNRANAVVLADKVEVRVGSGLGAQPLAVRQLELRRGTIVELVGPKIVADNSTWYPIVPPAGEYRFLPRSAILSPEERLAARRGADDRRQFDLGPAESDPQPPPESASRHPLFVKAERLEAAGDAEGARRAYGELARELRDTGGDYELSVLCYNRIDRLRDRTPARPAVREGNDAPFATAQNTRPQPQGRAAPPARMASRQSDEDDAPPPAREAPGRRYTTGPGLLRPTRVDIDGRRCYAHESEDGRPLVYVVARTGVPLHTWVGRNVELVGTITYRDDIRGGYYMTVGEVQPAR